MIVQVEQQCTLPVKIQSGYVDLKCIGKQHDLAKIGPGRGDVLVLTSLWLRKWVVLSFFKMFFQVAVIVITKMMFFSMNSL